MKNSSQYRYRKYKKKKQSARRKKLFNGCIAILVPASVIAAILLLMLSAYLFFPQRTNILILGLDYSDPTNATARTDTIILSTFVNPDGYVGLLSIPRDLWVSIPGMGNNRINTAHFFAEANQPGSGPFATEVTVERNFGVDVDYFLRIKFDGFREIVDAMGGLDIKLDEPMAGYEAGEHHLTGRKALAFFRNRTGSDDFFRMERGQLVIKAIYQQMLNPLKWIHIPAVISAFSNAVESNIPTWQWPRIIFILLRAGVNGIDNRTINIDMTSPYITEDGASVLLPRWEYINPILFEIFEQ